MANQWGRLYYEWAHDLKVQTMTEADQRRHAMLLCMHIEGITDAADSDVAFYMRIGLEDWRQTKTVFIERGFLAEDGSNHLTNWERRQYKSDSSSGRVARHRQKKQVCNVSETLQKRFTSVTNETPDDRYKTVSVTPPDTDTDTDTEEEIEAKASICQQAGLADCPQQAIVALYHEVLSELPPVKTWPPTLQANLRQRWREDRARQNLDWWRNYFQEVRKMDFLMGRTDKPWLGCNLAWLVSPKNMAKVLNGQYAKNEHVKGDLRREWEFLQSLQ